MTLDDSKAEIVDACGALLIPQGYRYVKSRAAFERKTATDLRSVFLLFVTSNASHNFRIWCGVRNNEIERVFHRTSGIASKHRARYTTIQIGPNEYWALNTDEELAAATKSASDFIRDSALPFLGIERSLSEYSEMLNESPGAPCRYHANPENRCHYGLISSWLCNSPDYGTLKETYSKYLQSINNGFYYPRFEALVADLESTKYKE